MVPQSHNHGYREYPLFARAEQGGVQQQQTPRVSIATAHNRHYVRPITRHMCRYAWMRLAHERHSDRGDQGNEAEPTEYLLPSVVHELMAAGEMTVGVVPTSEPWVGVTNPDDLEVARRRIAEVRQ